MAGGIGSRFWPMSTQKYPKQFQDILGTGRTMIQQTYDRIRKIVPAENIYVITNREYISLTEQQLPEVSPENIVGEPMMKNTAACNIYMAKKIGEKNEQANIIVLPADHLILKENIFLRKAELAFNLAEKHDYLITLGIKPTRPDTGYGYIQFVEKTSSEYFKVKTFFPLLKVIYRKCRKILKVANTIPIMRRNVLIKFILKSIRFPLITVFWKRHKTYMSSQQI